MLAPVAQSLLAEPDPDTGDSIDLSRTLLPAGLRTPVSLNFGALGVINKYGSTLVARGDFVMGAGALIETDPKAAVSISGDTVAVLGSIFAPGGSITITGNKNPAVLQLTQSGAVINVDLGPSSVLSTAGTTLLTPDPRGYHTGSVLAGGTINISGNIAAETGALLDVSGASDTLDFLPAYSGQSTTLDNSISLSAFVPTHVESNGGAITFKGDQELFMDATLRGAGGGASTVGGSLTVSSGRFLPVGVSTPLTPLDITMTVTQSGPTVPLPFYPAGATAIGHAVVDADGNALSAGHFAADSFNSSGLNALAIKGTVDFSGPVSLRAPGRLAVADGGVIFANDAVTLTAPYVALGAPFQPPTQPQLIISAFTNGADPFYFAPTFGAGRLTVNAGLIDIGNLSLQGIGNARFIADNGDIRGDGGLDVAGNIYMRAGQIYPPTAVSFTIAAYDYTSNGVAHSGSVTFAGSGERDLPLSAGGELNVYASTITQGGVLRAPIGTINLGWDGTGTAPRDLITGQGVAAAKNVTLTSGSVTSVSAVDPTTGQALVIPYGTNLNGTSWIDPSGLDITTGGVLPRRSRFRRRTSRTRPGRRSTFVAAAISMPIAGLRAWAVRAMCSPRRRASRFCPVMRRITRPTIPVMRTPRWAWATVSISTAAAVSPRVSIRCCPRAMRCCQAHSSSRRKAARRWARCCCPTDRVWCPAIASTISMPGAAGRRSTRTLKSPPPRWCASARNTMIFSRTAFCARARWITISRSRGCRSIPGNSCSRPRRRWPCRARSSRKAWRADGAASSISAARSIS